MLAEAFRRGRYSAANGQQVWLGIQLSVALDVLLDEWGVARAMLVTNTSLSGSGRPAASVQGLLGRHCVGYVAGVGAHAPMEDVVRIVRATRDADADLIVGLGGGSVCSAIKIARLALANGVNSVADLQALADAAQPDGPLVRAIAIPTTLSAGEFTPFAGARDPATGQKRPFHYPGLAPDAVVMDAALVRGTPLPLWLATGIRALDHIVETWCSVDSSPLSDAAALHASRLLVPALEACARSGERRASDDVLHSCQAAAWLAIQGVAAGVAQGASHGIGHELGGLAGMPHGITSCIMLPQVLRFNASVNLHRQDALAAYLEWPSGGLADGIAALVASLGLPGRLRDAGISKDVLPRVADAALHNAWVRTNPRVFDDAQAILGLLEQAW